MGRFWAWLAGALFALLAADPSVQGTAANTELFMLCPLILSQIAFVTAANTQKKTVLFMVLAGALTGVALMFKQVAIVNWLLCPRFIRYSFGEKTDGGLQFHSPLGQRRAS